MLASTPGAPPDEHPLLRFMTLRLLPVGDVFTPPLPSAATASTGARAEAQATGTSAGGGRIGGTPGGGMPTPAGAGLERAGVRDSDPVPVCHHGTAGCEIAALMLCVSDMCERGTDQWCPPGMSVDEGQCRAHPRDAVLSGERGWRLLPWCAPVLACVLS